MLLWVLLILIIFIIYYIYSNHIHVLWKSLFKKGFTKNDDFYGLYLYDGKQRHTVRHIQPFVSLKIFSQSTTILL